MKLSKQEVEALNDLSALLSYKRTPIINKFLKCRSKLIGIYTGNQFGKTSVASYSYVLRVMGLHPVPEKNVDYPWCEPCGLRWSFATYPRDNKCPKCGATLTVFMNSVRVIRFASETLPGQSANEKTGGLEVKNTQYPEWKKWAPPSIIKKDITARSPSITVRSLLSGGPDITIEFVSYGQSTQSTAGTQRFSVWEDEEAPLAFHEEQLPRLLAADGDLLITLTAANRNSWNYDEVFERADEYIRSRTICDKFGLPPYEKKSDRVNISVFQAATDDNPTLRPDVIERLFESYDDPDVIAIRRYGIFKQVSGRILKSFDFGVHVINESKYFPTGVPASGTHARLIDYHERTNWAVGWAYLSEDDELFIYDELNPCPEMMVTKDIAEDIGSRSGPERRFTLNLIDPLAQKTQSNTGMSVVDDLNRIFLSMKREGVCTGGFWQPWDTKSTRGRDQLITRLKNSVAVGVPFNNVVTRNGRAEKLPTVWIFSRCKNYSNSFKNWRWEEWSTASAAKEDKDTPQQKWSHFPMTVEAVLKDLRFRPTRGPSMRTTAEDRTLRYFTRERATA
jgi:hypothetical protein